MGPFGSVSGLFWVRFGVLGEVGVGSGRGVSVREKNMDAAFFAYTWKLPAYKRAFLLTIDHFSFFTYIGAFLFTA